MSSSSSSSSSGTRNSGDILLYDVRQKDSIGVFQSHRQEVCGMKWCPNGRYLASGSNDNTVCVWDFQHQRTSTTATRQAPLWHFKEHRAAVKVISNQTIRNKRTLFFRPKAIAWCPWEGSKVLVTGGGHSDGYLRFWNNNNGTCQQAVKTDSQVRRKRFSSTRRPRSSFRFPRSFGPRSTNSW